MSPTRYRYLIYGVPRTKLAEALTEYRAFIAASPDDPLAETLADVSHKIHIGLHEARQGLRAIGERGKVNEKVAA